MSREAGAHSNWTTAGSTAGKGFVKLGWFPTVIAKTCEKEKKEAQFKKVQTWKTNKYWNSVFLHLSENQKAFKTIINHPAAVNTDSGRGLV